LILHGRIFGEIINGAEIFDSETGTFRLAPEQPIAAMTTTSLEDGRVLIVGGQGPRGRITAEPQIFTP
jgi:hypothetical protein